MIMVTYPPALRRTGFGPPRAIGHIRDAIAEARSAESQPVRPLRPAATSQLVRAAAPRPAPPQGRTVVRLWLPATLLFLLLAPFAIVLSPLGWFVPRRFCARPITGVFVLGRVLLSLGGTELDVDTPDARIHIRFL